MEDDILGQLEDDLKDFHTDKADLDSLSNSCKSLVKWLGVVEAKENELKDVKEQVRKLAEEIIPEAMQQLNLDQLKLDNGVKISILDNVYAHISEAKKPDAYNWLRDNGLGAIIKNEIAVQFDKTQDSDAIALKDRLSNEGLPVTHKESIHPSTLKSTVKELVKKGINVPEDTFNIFIGKKAKIQS
jgi:hypothetical protein